MEPNAFPHLQLWCPRPFGTYSQNKPCPSPGSTKKPFSCRPTEEPAGARAPSENTPPAPADVALAPPASAEEGRVLLDTWYVIKPGNTKEKVAFFVAHQCSGGIGSGGTSGRASTMKVKGNWGSDSSKAKRRRRCHDPTKSKPNPAWATGGRDPACPRPFEPSTAASEAPDLLSVAEMVALVEQRTALALQSFPRPCGAPAAPVVFVEAAGGETKAPSGSDCSRVAEAVAHFESRQREHGGTRPNGLCRPGTECAAAAAASSAPGPGEVRIAFRISSGREPRAGAAAAEPGGVGRPNCVFMSCGTASGSGNAGGRAKDKITCDLYQLISPSRDTLPNNVEFLLATAGPKGDGDVPDVDMGCGEGSVTAVKPEMSEGTGEGSSVSARDCASGFHVDVVVTGVVDQCVFFGKDSAKKMKEETVRLPAAAQEDPPPGQLFLLPVPEETPVAEDAEAGEEPSAVPDPSLCRLYRHVSHDFLEIRFKIQRLLEPRQYMLLLPEHVMVKIFSYLPTQALAALKCSCHYFKSIIETFGVQATDSRWNRDPLYRDDPCKQCKKHYEKGDVSLCRWHPKPYHHDLPYGRSYWMCCRRPDKEAPGCRVGLHDNNWVHPATRRDDSRGVLVARPPSAAPPPGGPAPSPCGRAPEVPAAPGPRVRVPLPVLLGSRSRCRGPGSARGPAAVPGRCCRSWRWRLPPHSSTSPGPARNGALARAGSPGAAGAAGWQPPVGHLPAAPPAGTGAGWAWKPHCPPGSSSLQHIVECLGALRAAWHVELDAFEGATPRGLVTFTNVVATVAPTAPRRLVLACHYDTKVLPPDTSQRLFLGATDSAVPCAILLELAAALDRPLQRAKDRGLEVTLQLLFLDGEEAFGDWSDTDSLYGARHLAARMATTPHGPHDTQITAMSLLVLLDLLGARHPAIHSHFPRTHHWFLRLVAIEQRLRRLGLLHTPPQDQPFFRLSPAPGPVEDDHIPFLQRGVPVLHLIPTPFPPVWHTLEDTVENLHPPTMEDLSKILVAFVAEFLQL